MHARNGNYCAKVNNTGQGVTQDYLGAHMWFDVSSASGDGAGVAHHDRLLQNDTAAHRRAQETASECQQHSFKGCD